MEAYTETIECICCQGGRRPLRYPEGGIAVCPCCKDTGVRQVQVPHPSHEMTEWRTEIRAPAGTPRFYGVRECTACGGEEMQHPAGHFLNRLSFPCTGKNEDQ